MHGDFCATFGTVILNPSSLENRSRHLALIATKPAALLYQPSDLELPFDGSSTDRRIFAAFFVFLSRLAAKISLCFLLL